MPQDTHPHPDQLRDYLLGKLPAEALDDVACHLDHCPTCESTVASLDNVADTLVSQLGVAVPPPSEPENSRLQSALQMVLRHGQPAAGDEAAAGQSLGRLGAYQLLAKLGEGGMGAVYQALHTKLEKIVALKVLPRDKMNPPAVARFEREMRAVGKLDHPNIVRAHDAGESDGMHFLVMEYVDGVDLGSLARDRGPLPVAEACELVRQAALGLQYAHEHGLVHRDIKPSNLMLTRGGQVKVLDLGLALLADRQDAAELTSSGQIMGTIDYMAPEQGQSSHLVDIRADIYALGATLYKLLTGHAPFAGAEYEGLMRKMVALATEPHVPLSQWRPDVPAGLSDFVDRLLAKDPDERPATPQEVADTLADFSEGADVIALAGAAAGPTAGSVSPTMMRARSASTRPSQSTARPVVMPKPAGSHSPPRRRGMWLALGGFGAAALVLGGIILIINSRDGKEKLRTALQPGDEIKLVEQEEPAPAPGSAPLAKPTAPVVPALPAGPADREQPFVVVRAGGSEKVDCGTLARALEVHRDGDTIEIHGNGPFLVSGFTVKQKGLSLRAAPGYRPVLQGTYETRRAFLLLEGVRLVVEGCDFRTPAMNFNHFFLGSGPSWEFKNCRFVISGSWGAIFGYTGERLVVTDSLIAHASGWDYPDCWLDLKGPKGEVEFTNCIIRAGGKALMPVVNQGEWKFTLKHNTIVTSAMLFPRLDKTNGKVQVVAEGNIFRLNEANSNAIHYASYDTWKDKVEWQGSDNLYVGVEHGLAFRHDKDGKKRSPGLAGWEQFAGRKEIRAREAPAFFPAWREAYQANTPQEIIAAIKRLTSDRGRALMGVDIGPDWNLVGPGDAYVRALAAQGKGVPAGELRPKPFEGGVFVLLRDGKPIKGFDRLPLAFDEATTGDVIEIRTSDEVAGTSFSNRNKIKSLTVRAAPGHTPVVTGPIAWAASGLALGVEGIHFRGGPFNVNGGHSSSGKENWLTRLANCTISQPTAVSWAEVTSAIGDPWTVVEAPVGGICLIENCAMPGWVNIGLGPQSQLIVRNSALGCTFVAPAGEGAAAPRLELDRSVLFHPASFSTPESLFRLSARGDKETSQMAVHVHGCWLESTNTLLSCSRPGVMPASWTGGGNVYAAGAQMWYSVYQGKPPVIARGLSDWKNAWKSDADSVELEPCLYDPRMWKLLPGTPGHQQGPDGMDLGADVSRIAVTAPAADEVGGLAKLTELSGFGKPFYDPSRFPPP